MTRDPMIQRLMIESFGCIQKVDIRLSSLHAFIGPNDGGKSTLLKAAYMLGLTGWGDTKKDSQMLERAKRMMSSLGRAGATALAVESAGHTYEICLNNQGKLQGQIWKGVSEDTDVLYCPSWSKKGTAAALDEYKGARFVRFDPKSMRQPSTAIAEDKPIEFRTEGGFGLPAVYDAIRERDWDAFRRIEREVQELFPHVVGIDTYATAPDKKILQIKLRNGTIVNADQIGDGLLRYLGLASLPLIEPASLLLIEEPARSLHPSRVKDVVAILKELSDNSQVLLTTHNPMVLNELKPEQISVVARTQTKGTQVTPLVDTPMFEQRQKAYQLGALWMSFAAPESH